MQIDIKPDDVDNLVKNAILQAGLGKAIAEGIRVVLGDRYNNPVNKKLELFIGDLAEQLIREKFADQIKDATTKYLESCITKELIDATVSATCSKLVKAINDNY